MQNEMLRFAAAFVMIAVSPITQAQPFGFPITKPSVPLARTSTDSIWLQARKDNTAVGTEISTASPDGPEGHVQKPRVSFLEEAVRAAAAEVREGTGRLRNEADRATGIVKEAFTALRPELENLTEEVKEVTVTSTQNLQRAFVRTEQAVNSWSKEKIRKARQELKAAAKNAETAMAHAKR